MSATKLLFLFFLHVARSADRREGSKGDLRLSPIWETPANKVISRFIIVHFRLEKEKMEWGNLKGSKRVILRDPPLLASQLLLWEIWERLHGIKIKLSFWQWKWPWTTDNCIKQLKQIPLMSWLPNFPVPIVYLYARLLYNNVSNKFSFSSLFFEETFEHNSLVQI